MIEILENIWPVFLEIRSWRRFCRSLCFQSWQIKFLALQVSGLFYGLKMNDFEKVDRREEDTVACGQTKDKQRTNHKLCAVLCANAQASKPSFWLGLFFDWFSCENWNKLLCKNWNAVEKCLFFFDIRGGWWPWLLTFVSWLSTLGELEMKQKRQVCSFIALLPGLQSTQTVFRLRDD